MKYTYDYPMPSITATIVVLCAGHVLLIKRKDEPFKDMWALPGGFMNLNETIRECAIRELEEETNLKLDPGRLTHMMVSDETDRDPRGRVVDHVFYSAVSLREMRQVKAGDDAADFTWYDLNLTGALLDIPEMAFDHERSLRKALSKMEVY